MALCALKITQIGASKTLGFQFPEMTLLSPQLRGEKPPSTLSPFSLPGPAIFETHVLSWKELQSRCRLLRFALLFILASARPALLPSSPSFSLFSAANSTLSQTTGAACSVSVASAVSSSSSQSPSSSPQSSYSSYSSYSSPDASSGSSSPSPSFSPSPSAADGVHAFPLRRLAFGSCFKTHEQAASLLSPLRALLLSERERLEAEAERRRELRRLENAVWHRVKEQSPNAWIWMGDAGYAQSHDVAAVRLALKQVKDVDPFRELRASLHFLDGTWDDHDYGMNDGGRFQKNREQLRQAFLDFLDTPAQSPRRQGRRGVYSSHVFGVPVPSASAAKPHGVHRTAAEENKEIEEKRERMGGAAEQDEATPRTEEAKETETRTAAGDKEQVGSESAREEPRTDSETNGDADREFGQREGEGKFLPGTEVKLILLDTRYERDNHVIPSAGMLANASWLALIAASTRMFCHLFSLGGNYEGDILGEEQWRWLEAQLTNSTASVHLIVSSIQVSTTLPLVESWGHFPRAKQRLIDLLESTKPAGVLFLSGDVHFGEISGSERNVLEVTSSGMTHTAGDSFWKRLLLEKLILPFYSNHRRQPSDVYVHRNFGVLDVRYLNANEEEIRSHADAARLGPVAFVELDLKIRDSSTGVVGLSAKQTFSTRPASASPPARETDSRARGTAFARQNFAEFSAPTPAVVLHPRTWTEAFLLWLLWPLFLLLPPALLCFLVVRICRRRRGVLRHATEESKAGEQKTERKKGGRGGCR
uniref:Phosphodiesterase/alkaline phosphatase D family protein n=1 Tax=Toxoplasma gondii COUG TaxID=1074873 RepID=A0A2G8Y3X0_TOXGO|nr:phosphodiesterase/alkaline phosphatase D family protein [Toxoplasma gondii COUG]